MAFENERATTVFEQEELQVVVVQIASRLVRQIIAFVPQGQNVELGQRFGAIRFGSQVDVVIPKSVVAEICIKPEDKVRTGETVIAKHLPVSSRIPA
jgi:phosphatidylserine decarboxylase